MQLSSETATASAGAAAHARAEAMSTHATPHRAKRARATAKPMAAHGAIMERRTTAITSEETATKQATGQSTATEQEGKNQDNNDEGQHCNALLSSFFPK